MALRGLRMGLCAISGLCRVTLNVPLSTVSTTAGLSCGKKKRERERAGSETHREFMQQHHHHDHHRRVRLRLRGRAQERC